MWCTERGWTVGAGAFRPGKESFANIGRNQQSCLISREHDSLDTELVGDDWYGLQTRRLALRDVNRPR